MKTDTFIKCFKKSYFKYFKGEVFHRTSLCDTHIAFNFDSFYPWKRHMKTVDMVIT